MNTLPPIETLDWPVGQPLPRFTEIVHVAAHCCDVEPEAVYGREAVARRDTQATMARHIAYQLCERLLGMSGVEITSALGISSRSIFVSSRSSTYRLAQSPVGTAMVNEACYCLQKITAPTTEPVQRRERENDILLGDGDFREAARAALRNHAGGAA